MKNREPFLLAMAAGIFLIGSLGTSAPAAPAVTMTVLNPRGEIVPPKVLAPRPRLADLAGKRIGIYWNGKAGGNYFWNVIEGLVKQKYPTATINRYDGAYDIGDPLAAKMAREVDTFLYGVGD